MFSELQYATVVLDVDSTVSGIEGIDWLAALRNPRVARRIATVTDRAMAGEISLERIYGKRLQMVAPTVEDVDALGRAYIAALAPGCADSVAAMSAAGVRVVLISGGLRAAILPVARELSIPPEDVFAVAVEFSPTGRYAGFDDRSPLAMSGGKRVVVERADFPRPILAVGDGKTDAEMKPVVDTFAAFTGFVRREPVVAAAALELRSFAELTQLVLG
jgi:phosphoserine phosphatase